MGRSRSVTVAAAYAALVALGSGARADGGVSCARDAIRLIKAERPEAGPNYGFVAQLDTWLRPRLEAGGAARVARRRRGVALRVRAAEDARGVALSVRLWAYA